MGLTVILRGNNPQDRMSALGQKQTSEEVWPMSALPPKSGHWNSVVECLLCAKSGLMHGSKNFVICPVPSATPRRLSALSQANSPEYRGGKTAGCNNGRTMMAM